MRFIILGFLTLSAWSAFASYIYVCKIKELCNDPIVMQINVDNHLNIASSNAPNELKIQEKINYSNDKTVYFAFDKSDFYSNAETDKYVNDSKVYLDTNPLSEIRIIGHTDNIGTFEYNQSLGYRRAETMLHYFESKGVNSNKIILESNGENTPTDNNNTEAGRGNNRRTEITIK
jgi:outer membrane protein OmpA-like peptidoglycan-associated protein